MKKLTYILKSHISDRVIAVTSLVALMLCVSIVAQADYFMYSGDDNFTKWTDNAVASGSSPTFSISFNATTGRNYFVAYTGASANYTNISTDASVSVTKSGCSTCSNVQRQEWGDPKRYYALFSVSSASTVTVTFNTSTLAYTVSSGSAPVATNYYCVGSVSPWDPWCVTTDCDAANILSLQDGYYTKTFRKVAGDLRFRLKNATGNAGWMTMAYDESSPTNLNGITIQGTSGDDLTLSGVRGTHNKQTGFDFTIKYDASTNKTYLITTPYIFFKGPIFNKGNWNDDYGASCWEWTDISKVGDNWVFTYDWTINSTGLGTQLFTICTTTNENNGYKLANYDTSDLVGVESAQNGGYWNYKPTISISEGDNLRLRVTRRGPEDYKVELINLDVSTPAVRIGKKLTEVTAEGVTQGDVRVSAYIAATGCANVNKVKIFYANNSSLRNGEGYKSASVEKTLVSAVTENNQCAEDLYLTAAQVSSVVGKGETLYVRVKAINANDVSSDYSDVVSLIYNYSSIVPRNISESVTACNGSHRFKWTGEDGMFNPAPDPNGWSAKYNNASGADVPEGEFTLDGEYMIWDVSNYDDNDDDTPYLYTFYFTATKEGYTGANATLNMSLSAKKSDATVVIKQSGTEVTTISANPWHEVALTATRSDSGTGIEWTYPSTLIVDISNNGGNAKIKGTETTSSSLEVTARAVTATCGRSEPATLWVDINKIEELCTQP